MSSLADTRPAGRVPARLGKRIGWSLLGSSIGLSIVRRVCVLMIARVERRRGPATLESARGVIRLWHIDRFEQISLVRQTWILDDGTEVAKRDPVLDFHIVGTRLMPLLIAGTPWRSLMEEEFRSLVPALERRDEVALVGHTILWRQAAAFGASARALPPGLYRAFETFYRELIILAFHPDGIKRVLWHRHSIAETAISRRRFCRRFKAGVPSRMPA